MLSLPPPPSSLPPTPPPRPTEKQTVQVPLNQIVLSKQPKSHQSSAAAAAADAERYNNSDIKTSRIPPILQHPQPRQTNPAVWCGAIICFIFSLILIFFGIATLIIYLVIKPKNPLFDVPYANLNSVYFDSPDYFNGDLTFLANFSNPNKKIDLRFEYAEIELYFFNRLIGTHALQPFTQRRQEMRLELIHIISSLVYLPQNHAVELQKQVLSNRVNYNIRGTFKVRAALGLIHYSYWLHGRCEMVMTGPPTGVLVARTCKTQR